MKENGRSYRAKAWEGEQYVFNFKPDSMHRQSFDEAVIG
jgi:hypothetical protein